jgi:hypothetical protein
MLIGQRSDKIYLHEFKVFSKCSTECLTKMVFFLQEHNLSKCERQTISEATQSQETKEKKQS